MKRNTHLVRFSVFIIIFSFICVSFLHAQKIKVKTEDGIQVVYNPKQPAPPPGTPKKLILTQELSIGEKETEDYMFSEIFSFDVDDDGNIYVLDTKEACIKVFDRDGKHIRVIGRKGQGPGEIQMASQMHITAANEILLYDTANRRISFFSFEGECLKEIPAGKYMFARTIPDSKGNIIAQSLIFGEKPVYEIIKFDSYLNPILTLKTLPAEGFESNIIQMVRPVFNVRVMPDDHIAMGSSSEYEIHIVNPEGKTVRKIIKDYTPVKITDEEKEEWKKSFEGEHLPPGYKLETSNYQNPYWYFICGNDGRIYARIFEKDKKGYFYWDVFDSQGRYITKFSLPENEIIQHVKKNKMYILIRENEKGIPVVKRYNIEWK